MNLKDAIRRSAVWAAYGDALGFITELADDRIVRQRTGQLSVDRLMKWRRRIGGKFGADITLPQGCYSDDTQLRLATSRCIQSDGRFDVEVFAKVELPVWRAYALGAGRGTKLASQSLAKSGVAWWSNFFSSRGIEYLNAGGNGAAMRIQPHVWASPLEKKDALCVCEIIRNAIVTHGHFRGILGAAFHGLCLRESLKRGRIPGADDWSRIIENLQQTEKVIRLDNDLKDLWVPRWESESRRRIGEAINVTIEEMREDIHLLTKMDSTGDIATRFRRAVLTIDAFSDQQRGSGTKTAILAAYLASECRDPQKAVVIAANTLGSDTDSIATMVGAVLGVVSEYDPPESVMDLEYIASEAERIHEISGAGNVRTFSYPDLLYWTPPKVEADVVSRRGDDWHVAGLGDATAADEYNENGGRGPSTWKWLKLKFGQTLLLKCGAGVDKAASRRGRGRESDDAVSSGGRELFNNKGGSVATPSELSLEEALSAARMSSFDPRVVGAMLLQLASSKHGTEKAIAFAQGIVVSFSGRG